jgi:3-dehydroquinate synthetase
MSRQIIIYAKSVLSHLPRLHFYGIEGVLYEIDGEEKDKSWDMYLKIIDFLIENDFKKSDLLVGVGGGALLDLVGFVASTYMRGVDVVFVPTTLLGMVDASVGGKNGINRPFLKNSIGTTYLPKKTVIDTAFLTTLPEEQLLSGYVEVIKIAVVHSFKNCHLNKGDFIDPKIHEDFLRGLEYPLSKKSIERARDLKRQIVDEDPHEKGIRYLLNFGHTIGHALEASMDFSITHGEAVQHGIRVEMAILGFPTWLQEKIATFLPFKKPFPRVDSAKFGKILQRDKKNRPCDIAFSNVIHHKMGDFLVFFPYEHVMEIVKEVMLDDCLYSSNG